MAFKPRQFKKTEQTTKPVSEPTSKVQKARPSEPINIEENHPAPIDKESLIFGKDKTTHIVSVEVEDEKLTIFREVDGVVSSEVSENLFWIVNPSKADQSFSKLDGGLHYDWIKTTGSRKVFEASRRRYPFSWSVWNPVESAMIYNGISYFKGMEVSDVSVLSFDLESCGLLDQKRVEVFMISNTYKSQGKVTKKLFSSDEFKSEGEMITAWCDWVREMDPSVMVAHNGFGYDFPYLAKCAKKCKVKLNLGRDGSEMKTKKGRNPDKFRVDGSQAWEYRNVSIYGRSIVDTMFLCVKWDFSRMLPNWRLKDIIEFLELSKKDRVFYDASKIKDNWLDPVERAKIKQYGIDDADDSLALYEKMIPAFFYLSNSVPKPFADMLLKASGGQINAMMVRSYIQQGYGLPQTSPKGPFKGGISEGYPGIYKNMYKIDENALYPSIMRSYNVCDEKKDPLRIFPTMVEYFTLERDVNKKLYKETGDIKYHHIEQCQKIVANSFYGMLSTPGLIFNSPENGSFVTEVGRELLKQAIYWATGKEFKEKD